MGIARIKFYQDKAKEWRWRFVAKNGRTLADSGEGYVNQEDCVAAAELVCGLKIVRQEGHIAGLYVQRLEPLGIEVK